MCGVAAELAAPATPPRDATAGAWRSWRFRMASAAALALVLTSACMPSDEPPLPEPPEGAQLVLELGDLEVYQAFEGELCAGTLRRIELHALGLAELFGTEPP